MRLRGLEEIYSMAKKNTQKKDQVESQELQARIDELENAYARARADYQNLERRVEQRQAQFIQLTKASVITRFINLFDNLEIAAQHLNDPGLDMIMTQVNQLLSDEGVIEADTEGQVFDPETMECVETVAGEKDRVVKVVQKGYLLGDRLIRPAKVHVGNGSKE